MSALAAGATITRFGIRRSAGAGLVLLALGALLTGLSPSFSLALICWAAAGAGAGTVFAAMYNALLAGVAKARMARALSPFYRAFNGGVAAGRFLGGLGASRLGLAAPIFFFACIAAPLAFILLLLLRVPPPSHAGPAGSSG